jgi:tricorn protease-like protein
MYFFKTITAFCFFLLILNSCKKLGCQSSTDYTPPPSPYQDPVWYPNGTILFFNHQVLKSVSIDRCDNNYYLDFYPDSLGFWMINRDGTGMRRLTNFTLLDPAWSPDGKWIAFDNGGVIHKMAFDGANLDTSNIIAITDNSFDRFFPSWSSNVDTIYYNSNEDAPVHTIFHSIWKMAADGSGQTRITDTTVAISNGDILEPFRTSSNQILHFRYPKGTQQMQVYIMDSNGNNIKQITKNPNGFRYSYYLGYFNNEVFFEGDYLYRCNMDGSNTQKVGTNPSQGFSISKDGIIAYVNYDNRAVDKTHGTIWLTDINGDTNNPLTYNIY